jgi:multidrug efflux pump subunit AcrB
MSNLPEKTSAAGKTARYFTENWQVSLVLLAATIVWGVWGYVKLPKAKDPFIPVRVAVATCAWPGTSSEKIEQLVTRKMEQKIAENPTIEKIESISRTSVSIVYVTLSEDVQDRNRQFDDIQGKLDSIRDLPPGAGPINFIKDFGDTAALMLTVASPRVGEIELALRARSLQADIERVRAGAKDRATIVVSYPPTVSADPFRRIATAAITYFAAMGDDNGHILEGPGFIAIDLLAKHNDATLRQALKQFAETHLRLSELHPDVWRPIVVRDPQETLAQLTEGAGDKFSYRELDDYTDLIQRHLQSIPLVSKVNRVGALSEAIYLDYSQEKLASYGLQPSNISDMLRARNIVITGGILDIQGKNIVIVPSGEITNERDLGAILVPSPSNGPPMYLRDLVDIHREYQSPARYLNYLTARDAQGKFIQSRAITIAVQMRAGAQIGDFGAQVDAKLGELKFALPEDLILRRTSDQPLQVRENVSLFMSSLYEAILLVVLVALIGFWDWRAALIMAMAIPITLAMTFGFMQMLGIDVQQVSIASLILALGLLIDVPVVAGDGIKRALLEGMKRSTASWMGPSRLAKAILFATITNIVAYVPMLAIKGAVGTFIYSLPVVMTAALVASYIVSMTFVPLLGRVILRPPHPKAHLAGPNVLMRGYLRILGGCIDRRGWVLGCALIVMFTCFGLARGLKVAFFPTDLSYLSYVDVWLPEDAPLSATKETANQANAIIREVAADFGKAHGHSPDDVLESVTTFLGGGGPRFWFSVAPELQQLNYAQLIIQVRDKHDTEVLVPLIQQALSTRVVGARLDVRQLETGKPVGVPVAVRIAGADSDELRKIGEQVKGVFRSIPIADRIRDDWGADTFSVALQVDPDRANLDGFTNLDVALSSVMAMNGRAVSQVYDDNRQIPILARMRSEERAELSDIGNLYVSSVRGQAKIPLRQISHIDYQLQTEKIRRRDQFRAITVACFPTAGVLPSEVLKIAQPQIEKISASLPQGYRMVIAGEQEERQKGFAQLITVLIISIVAIYLALLIQFKNAIKPLVVFAAIPFGVGAALLSLGVMDTPFGFMAFLGIISLIGVIVSHIIVLFDFIEEQREEGTPLRDALLNAGVKRFRPVVITVAATVLGLFPLALHGGPLWHPLCYAQIGGLTVATLITLILVPVLYTIMIRDLHWIDWTDPNKESTEA